MKYLAPSLFLLSAFTSLSAMADPVATTNMPAPTPGTFEYAILNGTPVLDMRYRYEFVDQKGIRNDANASTLRTRLGYTTGVYDDFKAGLEFENNSAVGSEEYNDTINHKTNYATVADPKSTSVYQAFLTYQGIKDTDVNIGRQVVNLDDQRFIGNSDWRQNAQTFDLVGFNTSIIPHANLFYAFVDKVNRVYGVDSPVGDFHSNSHLINASYEFAPVLKIVGYTYLLDFNDAKTLSTATYGSRWTGKTAVPMADDFQFSYAIEAAHQRNYDQNPLSISENYYLIEPAITAYSVTGKFGYEVLGGNGVTSFQTPLDSTHPFNGWATMFATIPVDGLHDIYGSLSYKVPFGDECLKGTEFTAVYHDFTADHTSTNYGTEWDGMITQTFHKHYTVGLEAADYHSDHFATDTTKFWAWLSIKY